MTKLRVCLIGAGRAGLIHARNIATRIPAAELVGICDASETNLQAAAEELGIKRLYRDYPGAVAECDAVVIVTPTFLHREIACFAAEHRKHVFLEKPMALSVGECEAINAAVAKAGVKLQIGFMRRFDDGFMQAKELLSSGEMGRVMIIKSTGRGPGGPGPWMYDLAKSNGIVAEVNSHDLDSVMWLTGLPIERVFALAHNFKCPDAREKFPAFYDNVVVSLGFAGGAMGTVDGTCPAHYGYDARVEILCESGLLMIGSYQQQGNVRVTLKGEVQGRTVGSWRNLFKDAYLAEMNHFVECVLNDRAPRVTGLDGLKAVEAAVAVNTSIQTSDVVWLGRKECE